MKIQIRKSVFETNSSSTHSLIITNQENKQPDIEQAIKNEEPYWVDYLYFNEHLTTKDEKVLMLGGLFDFEIYRNHNLKEEYKVFLKILKDNNEKELLAKLEENRKNYLTKNEEPYCTNCFYNGCLIDCNCQFYQKFHEYFYQKNDNENEDLYQKLFKFIYQDGIIIPYETAM